jgi:glycosyltransferase involved in cell wall biosynthesis
LTALFCDPEDKNMPPSDLADLRGNRPTLLCLSHLRWHFVYQRPQHLLSRAANYADVFFFEEPVFGSMNPRLEVTDVHPGVQVLVPHLPAGTPEDICEAQQRELLDEYLAAQSLSDLILWYYTPMALGFTGHLQPDFCVYDCMDELTAFRFAPPRLIEREIELLARCDVVFTGGQSLFEAKRGRHPNLHCFPSSIDKAHFAQARQLRGQPEPTDQSAIPPRRAGFAGVIDERMDLELLRSMAEIASDLQFVMLGPVVKVEPGDLPRLPNIHWLGPKQYAELPRYLAGWDCGIMPFALNESTRFISPTKTPEYLAAGLPVVSTDINDVRRPYFDAGLVSIATTAAGFVREIERPIALRSDEKRMKRVDQFLADKSWDSTFAGMAALIREGYENFGLRSTERVDGSERVW